MATPTEKIHRLHQWLLYIVSVLVMVGLGCSGWMLAAIVSLQINQASTAANRFTIQDAYEMEARYGAKIQEVWVGVNEAQKANEVLTERVNANIKRMDDLADR